MKGNLDMNPPHSFTHIYNQAKKEKLEADIKHKILSENKILLSKLNRIANRDNNTITGTHGFDFNSRQTSLNGINRKLKLNQIQSEN